jgi:formamidopyrimidine-DNA glycosylase
VPELPEVEIIRRQLDPALTGRRIARAGAHSSTKFSTAVEATGATIETVRRRGKYLLIDLDDDRELIIHLGMTGRLRLVTPAGGARRDPHVRAWWDLGSETLELHDVRRFGRVAVVGRGDHRSMPTLHHLGPDLFDAAFTPDHLWRALRASSARVKTQLLSQRPVAGTGNIYADEALWKAGIHPGTRDVSRPKARRLHAALIEVMTTAVANGGTTLRDYRTLQGETGTNQFHLECYGRAGEPCLRCGDVLRRRVIDGRGTTWCPRCQRR